MAGTGGTVHLLVLPNAEDFHNKLKREVEKKKIDPYKVKIEPDTREWEQFKRDVQTEKTFHTVKVIIDDDNLIRALDELENSNRTIKQKLEMDTDQARDDLKRFQMDALDEPITKHVIADFAEGDRNMKEFRDKWDDKPIIQKVLLDTGDADSMRREVFGRRMRTAGEENMLRRLTRMSNQAQDGLINGKMMERELVDSINFLPKMMRSMNRQLDIGIRQIYDRYINAFGLMYKFTSKPFLNMREDLRQAENFGDLLDRTRGRSEALRTSLSRIGNTATGQFTQVFRETVRLQRQLRTMERNGRRFSPFSLQGAKDNLAILGTGLRSAMHQATNFKFPGLTAELGKIGPGLKSAFSDTVSQFTKDFPKLTRVIENTYWRIWAGAKTTVDWSKRMGNALVTNVGKAFSRIGDLSRTTFAAVTSTARRTFDYVTSGIRAIPADMAHTAKALGFWARMAAVEIGERFAKAGGFLRGALNNISLPRGFVGVGARISGLAANIKGSINATVLPAVNSALHDLLNSIDLSKRAAARSKQWIGALLAGIPEAFRAAGARVKSAFGFVTSAFDTAMEALSKQMARAREALAAGWEFTVKKIGGTFRRFGKAGSFITGTVGRFGRVFAPLAGVVGQAVGRMNGLFAAFRFGLNRMGRLLMGFNRIMLGTFAKFAGVLSKSVLPALAAVGAGIAALAGQTVVAQVMALGGAFQALAQSIGVMIPAAVGAAATAFYVLKVGVKDLGSAMSAALNAEDAEAFNEAIKDMPGVVQDIARATREFHPMFQEMKETIQTNMLQGLAPKVSTAIGALLPIFKDGAEKMAASWNQSFALALDALASPQAIEGTTEIMKGVEEMSRELEPFIANLIKAAGSLAAQGAKFLGPLGGWMTAKSEQFFNFTERLKEIDPTTGQSYFDNIVTAGQRAAGQLGQIFGGLFGALSNVLKAGFQGGQEMLDGMATGAQRLSEATRPGTENFEKMLGFMQNMTEVSRSLGELIVPLWGTLLNVVQTLSGVAAGAMDGVVAIADALERGTQNYEKFSEGFGQSVGNMLEATAPILESLIAALLPVVVGLGDGLDKWITPLMDSLKPAAELLGPLGEALGSALSTVGEALGKISASGFSLIFESLFNVLIVLLPIFEKVAYWIGEIGGAFFEAIKPMIQLRDDAVNGLIEAMGPLIDTLGAGLMAVIKELAPLFPMLGDLMSRVIQAVTPLIPVLAEIAKVLFVALIDVIKWLMPLIPPLIDIIVVLANTLSVILVNALNILLNIFTSVWNFISTLVQFIVNNVLVPLLNFLSATFNALATAIQWAVNSVIAPAMNAMSSVVEKVLNFFSWMIDNVAQPAINRLKGYFSNGVEAIRSIWNGLKAIFRDPIKWWIDVVINKGVVGGWNKVMGWINKEEEWGLKPVGVPAEMNFASGGVLPGMSVGRDNYNFYDPKKNISLGLAGGEAVMRQEFVSAVGGERGINKLNEDARHGRLNIHYGDNAALIGGAPGLAQGGVISSITGIVKQNFPMMTITSTYRPGDPGHHGTGNAVDFSNGTDTTPQMQAAAKFFHDNYGPGLFELIHSPSPYNIKNGQNVGDGFGLYGAGTMNAHRNHVHVASPRPLGDPTEFVDMAEFDGASVGSFNPFSWVAGKAKSLFDGIMGPFEEQVRDFGTYAKLAVGLGEKMVGHVAEGLMDKIKPIIGVFGGAGSFDGPGGISGNVESWRPMAMEAMRRNGFNADDPAQVNAMLKQIQSESGGNPGIAQQIVDVNGTGESAGVGLLQIIPGTFAAYRDPTLPDDRRDPWANMNAALRYYRSRYGGDLTTMWGQGHGYAQGGVLNFLNGLGNAVFDRGGMSFGKGLIPKNVIQPERVLSPVQTKAFNAFVYQFMPELINEFKRNPREFVKHYRKLEKELGRIYHELREDHIGTMQSRMMRDFHRQLNGENLQNNPVDLIFDRGWLNRNRASIEENLRRGHRSYMEATVTPDEFIEAEKRAREQVDAEREEARKARDEEEKAAEDRRKQRAKDEISDLEKAKEKAESQAEKDSIDRQIKAITDNLGDYDGQLADIETKRKDAIAEATKGHEERIKALKEERKERLKGVKDDAAKDAIRKDYDNRIDGVEQEIREVGRRVSEGYEDQKREAQKGKKAQDDAQRQRDKLEQERIERAKADGSYYYGHTVLTEDGTPLEERKVSAEEKAFRGFMESAGDRIGLGSVVSSLGSYYDDAMLIKDHADAAFPAWMAALNGDPRGLAYNVAVGQSRVRKEAFNDATEWGPDALAGIIEMAVSGRAAQNSAPFIGEVNSGMTQAELMQTLDHYETMRARRGTGTARMR